MYLQHSLLLSPLQKKNLGIWLQKKCLNFLQAYPLLLLDEKFTFPTYGSTVWAQQRIWPQNNIGPDPQLLNNLFRE